MALGGSIWTRELRLRRRDRRDVRLVGLRVGSTQLAAAHVHNNGAASLLSLARTPLEPGVVAAGEVRDPAALGDALKTFFAEHRLPRRGVRLGVASNRIGVRVLEVPAVDDPRQRENAIRYHAQQAVPFPIADAVLDHVVLGEAAGESGQPLHRVLIVFAHRALVDGYVDACRRAGVKLAGIDFDGFALLRAVAGGERSGAATVAISIGGERTIFAVSDGRLCDFARVLEWGGRSVDAALATALGIDEEAAEQLKRVLDPGGADAPQGLSPLELETARSAVRGELEQLARELLSSLRFYQSRPGSLDIGEVLLAGGGSRLPGLDRELARMLGVPVRGADPFARVEVRDGVEPPPAAGSLAIAVGLGIEELG